MLRFKFTSLIMALLVLPAFNYAQNQFTCGTSRADLDRITQRLLENKHLLQENGLEDRNEVIYVPITFHIVGETTTGNGSVSEGKVLEMLCGINEYYAVQNIQFYIKRFNYIKNTSLYNNPGSFGGESAILSNKKFDSINMYLPNSAGTPGVLGYYLEGDNYDSDWIIIIKNQVSYAAASTPAHELGHFFSLLHTFNGWECEQYDVSIHGVQVPLLAPCSNQQPPYNSVQNECQDGSNCEIAGDFICDTPPDYDFGYGFSPSCGEYPSNAVMDPCGEYVNPDEHNMMGYFIDCDSYHFSEIQKDLIHTDLVNNSHRNYLESNYVPNTAVVTGTPTLLTPANNFTGAAYNSITFSWSAVPGADKYLLEIDRFSSFTVDPYRVIVNGTTKVVNEYFEANKSYKWRVTPFNEYSTCASPSTVFSLTTGAQVGTVEIRGINDWTISPNPVYDGSEIAMDLTAYESFDAQLQMYDINGRLIQSQPIKVNSGENSFSLTLPAGIANGVYSVSIINATGVLNKKLVISK